MNGLVGIEHNQIDEEVLEVTENEVGDLQQSQGHPVVIGIVDPVSRQTCSEIFILGQDPEIHQVIAPDQDQQEDGEGEKVCVTPSEEKVLGVGLDGDYLPSSMIMILSQLCRKSDVSRERLSFFPSFTSTLCRKFVLQLWNQLPIWGHRTGKCQRQNTEPWPPERVTPLSPTIVISPSLRISKSAIKQDLLMQSL